ncbi:MAG: beta-lactamase [Flavipsychrobacter sp.]|jgi:hypothetical protein|nr:beta-lactamase [Flavipsychrobacter sp.]
MVFPGTWAIRIYTLAAFIACTPLLYAQAPASDTLYRILQKQDSLLFSEGFNKCDIGQFEKLVSENFEFYHDEAGIMSSKAAFIASIKDGICKLPYKPQRQLNEGSLEVFPLTKNGKLYGAIQNGTHSFYAIEKDKPERLTSTALFTHVWLLENGSWRLGRSLSYNHKTP